MYNTLCFLNPIATFPPTAKVRTLVRVVRQNQTGSSLTLSGNSGNDCFLATRI